MDFFTPLNGLTAHLHSLIIIHVIQKNHRSNSEDDKGLSFTTMEKTLQSMGVIFIWAFFSSFFLGGEGHMLLHGGGSGGCGDGAKCFLPR